jgi:hypothetical protein
VLNTRLTGQEHRARVMEDYALDLRRVLIAAGIDVPAWPDD